MQDLLIERKAEVGVLTQEDHQINYDCAQIINFG